MTLQKSANPDRTPVAKDLFTYCTREKTDTWHIVRNHDSSGVVDRVICKACGSEHKYRKVKVALGLSSRSTVVRSPRAATSSATSAAGSLNDAWLAGLKKWGGKEVVAFDPKRSFRAGEVFEHSVFGKGVVQARRENKIDVLFANGIKTLPSAGLEADNLQVRVITSKSR